MFKSKQQKQQQERERTLRVMAHFDKLEKAGYVFINEAKHMVAIDNDLAALFVGDDRSWQGFMQNLFLWFTYRQAQTQWGKVFHKAEADAVKAAKAKAAVLTRRDIAAVREQARQAVAADAVSVPTGEPMTFAIVSTARVADDAVDMTPAKTIVVGQYDGRECRMVPFNPPAQP